jgi:hypothetical protein
MMMVSYRTNGKQGTLSLPTVDDLSIAFNRVVAILHHEGWLKEQDVRRSVRCEGKVKIGAKKYRAITQGKLIVVAQGPKIPDVVKVEF